MRFLLLLTIALSFGLAAAQEKPVAFSLADVSYPVAFIQKDPAGKQHLLSLTGGRFLCYSISSDRLSGQSVPAWKNFSLEGFDLGGNAVFSPNGKYILLTEKMPLYNFDKVQVKPFRIAILEATSGNVVYTHKDINSAQFTDQGDVVLLFSEDEITRYNINTGEKKTLKAPLDIETAALNHAGNLLAVSYDAAIADFKAKHGAGYNKSELKNAAKNKKLISFFGYPSLIHVSTLSEEVDVVFSMEFTQDDKYLLFYSRTRQVEHQNVSGFNGLDKTRDLNQFQRIDVAGNIVDNQNFIYQTSEAQSNHDLDLNSGLFVYGDNKGLLAAKREIVVVNYNKQQDYLAKYTYQGRAGTRNLHSTAFNIIDDHTILVANGTKLCYWNFKSMPNYSEFIEPMNENTLLDKAVAQLTGDLEDKSSRLSETISKKMITGLYIFTITLQKAGEVVSVFAQSDDKTNISMQNILKDIMMKYNFDVNVPKNERIKFTYTFNL